MGFPYWIGVAGSVLFIIVCSAVRVWNELDPVTNNTIALTGAVMVCFGAFTVARPVIRVGGYRSWYEKSRKQSYGSIVTSEEDDAEDQQLLLDSKAVNFTGPALAISGTLINGASGLMSFS
ncbi:hypothetical protein [Agrobacterium pusense]|uniref:hypothetical protein n=1 Tax=Agrobacterium pusense TaxID=648995 RepID=UPI000DD07D9F|nr:hypothetical protein [Agrobacterium pusense]MBP2612364.1 hypothetical protein [Agrobacterium pusense]MCZ7929183.1 hypothetical protein [Agrobacterium pusense]